MASYFPDRVKSPTVAASSTSFASPMSPPGPSLPKSNALQGRIASVLAASYADLEIRDSLQTLDTRHIRNTAETRRNLRLEVQQELIECNGDIVQDFGRVAEVRVYFYKSPSVSDAS